MSSADAAVRPVVPPPAEPPRGVMRWLWTSNPFYAISAALFLVGLRLSFGATEGQAHSWALMGGLAGYTLLLAGAAVVLVRYAGVWDDVRTVLLLVVLMFLATSVTFDELLVLTPGRGVVLNATGLMLAVLITEVILRGVRLRLPAGFRVPYYLTLGLFFLYPVVLTPFLRDPHGEALLWGLFGFSSTAGLVFLTLLPAVRRGPGYVRGNGSPWPWPYYPWSLFAVLAVAVPARSFLLCWSLHLLDGGTMTQLTFGPYFVMPFGFAVAILVLELGLVSGSRAVAALATALPVVLVILAGVGHRDEAIYREFLSLFSARLGGSPLFVAVVAASGFYGYAWVRRVPHAAEWLTAALAALAFIGPDTLAVADARLTRPALLIVPFVLQVGLAAWRRDVWRCLVVVGLAAGWSGPLAWRGYAALRAEFAGLDYLLAGLALFPVAVLVSLGKAGVLRRLFETWRGRVTEHSMHDAVAEPDPRE